MISRAAFPGAPTHFPLFLGFLFVFLGSRGLEWLAAEFIFTSRITSLDFSELDADVAKWQTQRT
jgi:hypothetical protein